VSGKLQYDGEVRTEWNRWDTVGTTYCYGSTPRAAYAEVLAAFRQPSGAVSHLVKSARLAGTPLSEFVAAVAAEADERRFHGTGVIPESWRTRRRLFTISLPTDGWWADVEHIDSMASLDEILLAWLGASELSSLGVTNGLDTSHLFGPTRALTTAVAHACRTAPIDGDDPATGIAYRSRRGVGLCWAVFGGPVSISVGPEPDGTVTLRQTAQLPAGPEATHPISIDDEDLRAVTSAYGITVLEPFPPLTAMPPLSCHGSSRSGST